MARLAYGTFAKMTPEEQKEHTKSVRKAYSARNRDRLSEYNRRYAEARKNTKPFVCSCVRCHEEFRSPRKSNKICLKCWEKMRNEQLKRIETKKRKFEEQETLIAQVMELAQAGVRYSRIAQDFGVKPSWLSYTLRQRGIRQRKEHSRTFRVPGFTK